MRSRVAGPLLLCAALGAVGLSSGCPSGGVSPTDAIGTSRAGLGCYTDSQCGLDTCNLPLFPGGACVGTCDDAGACPNDPDAGPPQVCLGAANSGACLRGCELDGGCIRDGWICQDGSNGPAGGRVCLPDCRSDPALCVNAGSDFQCSTLDGICRVPQPMDAGLFGFCNDQQGCAAPGSCLSLTGERGDGGFCTQACTGLDGGAPDVCPSGGACLVSEGLSDGGSQSLCGAPCGSDSDGGPGCQIGLSCQPFASGALPDGGTLFVSLCAP